MGTFRVRKSNYPLLVCCGSSALYKVGIIIEHSVTSVPFFSRFVRRGGCFSCVAPCNCNK